LFGYHIDISSGFIMHKEIPIAIVRLRQKIWTRVLEN